MEQLRVCEGCSRHVKEGDARCPFCHGAMPPSRVIALVGAVTIGLGVSIGGCASSAYGGPPYDAAVAPDSGGDASADADGGLLGAYGPPPPQDAGAD